jgi:hypothetical protein
MSLEEGTAVIMVMIMILMMVFGDNDSNVWYDTYHFPSNDIKTFL